MSLSTNFEDTPSAIKGLFKSRPEMGKLGSWDKESDVDDSVVSEDRPWLSEYSDPDIGSNDPLSPEDDDSKESSTLKDIRTQNEVPTGNPALNLAVKPTEKKKKKKKKEKKKKKKKNRFLLPNYTKEQLECRKMEKKENKREGN
jgi:hypothetical protein